MLDEMDLVAFDTYTQKGCIAISKIDPYGNFIGKSSTGGDEIYNVRSVVTVYWKGIARYCI